mmetsp:Transcript_178090/g.565277  ORF Transcript_178090/g.565277 Transcript_178090/m.565277 type:complete len:125 (+) Transcript_178090:501-875(+)
MQMAASPPRRCIARSVAPTLGAKRTPCNITTVLGAGASAISASIEWNTLAGPTDVHGRRAATPRIAAGCSRRRARGARASAEGRDGRESAAGSAGLVRPVRGGLKGLKLKGAERNMMIQGFMKK